jgi:hypothetical protein
MQPPLVALRRVLEELDNDPSLIEPHRLRQRLEAMDRLEAYLAGPAQSTFGADPVALSLHRRARTIVANLEAVNLDLYDAIRLEIQHGTQPEAFLRSMRDRPQTAETAGPANIMGYDYLDDLIAGVLQLEEPAAPTIPTQPEIVPYQPTPARHIFNLLGLTALTASDVLVDLGSGLGHVPLLTSVCTPARGIGIELEPAYVARARQCAHRLNLSRATFLNQDVRETAGWSTALRTGTVFYLYTPFTGSILRHALDLLQREAATRPIRICTYGPCTPIVASEPWLESTSPPQPDRIALFLPRTSIA